MEHGRLRKFLTAWAAWAAAAVILSGCGRSGEATGTAADTSVQTFEAATAETVTIPEISCFAEEETEVPENGEPEYVEVSPNNEFIDFDFIEDYQGTDDVGELADKAVEFLTTTEEYAEAMSHFDEIDTEFGDPYIADGKIIPQFEIAYPNDYDGDGRTETFITVAMPFRVDYSVLTRFFLYADSEGNMTLLDHISGVYDTVFLNYGGVKQITFGGSGTAGIEDHTNLYGVKDGKADLLYSIRGEFHKKDCFLSAFGAQGSGAFMYYDTAACEYRAIAGEDIAIDKIKEMDSTDELSEFYEWLDEQGQLYAELIGGRYYVIIRGAMDTGTAYLYENGKFIQTEDCQYVRDSHYEDLSKVIDIDINKALAEMKKPAEPFVKVSPGNEFIDFDFIEDYRGTTDIGELADKAVEIVKNTEQYAKSVENINEFDYTAISKRHTEEKYAKERADKVAPYINGDNIEPLVSAAYTADYDGDGRTETFIVVDIPYIVWSYPDVWSFLLFADSDGTVQPDVIDFYEGYSASMLDYGKNKHLIFSGWDGMHSYASIYGVKDGRPVILYDHCPGGYFRKTDCFLSAFGLQGTSDFMYFDTVALEYRQIKGAELSLDEMKELDVSETLCSHCNAESLDDLPDYVEFHFIKPNYYLIDWGFPGSHLLTYENGVFTYDKDSNITRSSNYSKLDAVAEFDIDKAVSEMKKPAEPFVKVSPGNEFIDFDFIEDYQGTTDIGDLADKAVEFLITTEEYAESMEHIDEITDEKFAPYIKDGVIVPKLNTAYPEDYDGDGRTETFIVADMPILQGKQPIVRSFLIFADSGGHITLLGDESDLYDTILLDYGRFKQMIWGGFGTCGADENTCIYGVTDGQAKPLYSGRFAFRKENCFLTTHGHMNGGDFMYYDAAADDYVPIAGVEVTLDEIKAMDKDGALADYYEGDGAADYFFGLVGGKYYCVNNSMDITEAVFTFDGKFERVENSNVRLRFKDYYRSGEAVINIDIDKALAEMISVK